MPEFDQALNGSGSNTDGMTATLEPHHHTAEARLRKILSAILAFRDGNFGERLPTEWPGTEGRIAEAFNQVIGNEERIAREVARMSTTVGKEGRIKQRMSVPGRSAAGPRRSIP
jgi:hypothetical protein